MILTETIYIHQGNAMTELPADQDDEGKAEVEEPATPKRPPPIQRAERNTGLNKQLCSRLRAHAAREPRSRAAAPGAIGQRDVGHGGGYCRSLICNQLISSRERQ